MGRVFLLIVGFVVALGLTGASPQKMAAPQPKTNNNGGQAQREREAFLPKTGGQRKSEDRQNESAEQANKIAERDLQAQQAMALLALIQLGLTGGGLWLIYETLRETRKAVQDTTKATEAMMHQNLIAERAQRAWITVDVVPVALSPEPKGREFIFDAVFKNIGQSVTEIHAYFERCHPSIRVSMQREAVEREIPERGIPILPNEEFSIRVRMTFPDDPIFLAPFVLGTVIYKAENRRCAGSYVFGVEKKAAGIILGGALFSPGENALGDQILIKRENPLTMIV